MERVTERVPGVDPRWLWRQLVRSIESDDGWARFKQRQKGARVIYYFEVHGERVFAVVHLEQGEGPVPVTILPAHTSLKKCRSKKAKRLTGFHEARGIKKRKRKEGRRG